MFKYFFFHIMLLFLNCDISYAHLKPQTDTIKLPPKLLKFIPAGYTLLDTAMGDLNLDQFKDVIMVLKKIGEDSSNLTIEYKRPLLILLGHAGKIFTLAERNDNIVYCYNCGGMFGDPYDGITIKKGQFAVYHFGGSNDRWSNEITFRFSRAANTWYLFKIVDKSWSVFNLKKVETIIQTKKDFGEIQFEKYNPDEDENIKQYR